MSGTAEEAQGKTRPAITIGLVVCLAIAIAPWFSGGQEPVAMLLSGGALLAASGLVALQPAMRHLVKGPLLWSFAALMLYGVIALTWSANRYLSVIWIGCWLSAGVAFFVAYTIAGQPKGRDYMVNAYVVSAVIFSIVALMMFFTSAYGRLIGTFYWPNPAAAYLMPAIIFALDRVRRDGNLWWVALCELFLCSFLLTDSRAATLVLALVLALEFALVRTSKRFWTKLVFIILTALLLSTACNWATQLLGLHASAIVPGSRLAEVLEGQSSSVSQRVQYFESAIRIWLSHPIVGSGPGTYGALHPSVQKSVMSASTDAHDLYIQLLAEMGVIGIILVGLCLLWIGLGIVRGLAVWPRYLPIAMGALALLLHFGLDIDAQYPALLMLVAVLFGLVWRGWNEVSRRSGVMPTVIMLAMMIPLSSAYTTSIQAERGLSAQDSGDSETASAYYALAHTGVTYDPDNLTAEGINEYALANMGGKYAYQQAELALELADDAERQDPYNGEHYQLAGRVMALEGKYRMAAGAFSKALKLDPYDEPSYALDLATVQLQMGETRQALATAKSMLALYPMSVVNERLADATLKPTLADIDALVGNIYLNQRNFGLARRYGKAGASLDHNSVRVLALLHQIGSK